VPRDDRTADATRDGHSLAPPTRTISHPSTNTYCTVGLAKVAAYAALVINFDAIFGTVPAVEQERECLLGLLNGPLGLFSKDGKLGELAAVLARDDVGDVAVHI
jgi:hypothetical protein